MVEGTRRVGPAKTKPILYVYFVVMFGNFCFLFLFPEIISSSSGRSHMCCLCLSMLGQVEVPGMFYRSNPVLITVRNGIQA